MHDETPPAPAPDCGEECVGQSETSEQNRRKPRAWISQGTDDRETHLGTRNRGKRNYQHPHGGLTPASRIHPSNSVMPRPDPLIEYSPDAAAVSWLARPVWHRTVRKSPDQGLRTMAPAVAFSTETSRQLRPQSRLEM